MKHTLFVKPKGLLTMGVGLIFLLAPGWVMSLLGADMNAAGILLARLFGLLALGMGWSMLIVDDDFRYSAKEAFNYVIWDVVGIVLVIMAVRAGVLGSLGYALAAVYLISASGFLSCALTANRN